MIIAIIAILMISMIITSINIMRKPVCGWRSVEPISLGSRHTSHFCPSPRHQLHHHHRQHQRHHHDSNAKLLLIQLTSQDTSTPLHFCWLPNSELQQISHFMSQKFSPFRLFYQKPYFSFSWDYMIYTMKYSGLMLIFHPSHLIMTATKSKYLANVIFLQKQVCTIQSLSWTNLILPKRLEAN